MTPPTPLNTFLAQCKRRFGHTNPDQVHLEHWEWMVRHRRGASKARRLCGVDLSTHFNFETWQPDWCFDRFGMSRTQMPDGRVICIGGEHEDGYALDFCIYNDVVVLQGAVEEFEIYTGPISIFTYPREVFPPTDFHSATLVNQSIFVIGSIGYRDERRTGFTPVHVLDTSSYQFRTLTTTGSSPGWISSHHHRYEPHTNSIIVRGGQVMAQDGSFQPNHAVHRLHLNGLAWEVLSEHESQHRFIFRPQEKPATYVDLEQFHPAGVEYRILEMGWNAIIERQLEVEGVRIEINSGLEEVHLLIEGELQPATHAEFLNQFGQFLLEWTEVAWTREQVDKFPDPWKD